MTGNKNLHKFVVFVNCKVDLKQSSVNVIIKVFIKKRVTVTHFSVCKVKQSQVGFVEDCMIFEVQH